MRRLDSFLVETNELAEFYRRRGHTVLRTDSCFWYDMWPHFFSSLPEFVPVSPDANEIRHVKRRAWVGLRFLTDSPGASMQTAVITCRDKEYSLHSLEQKARNQTRRGLENCRVLPIDFSRLEHEGPVLYQDTLLRQGRRPSAVTSTWSRFCRAGSAVRAVETYGAYCGEQLAAFLVGATVGDWFVILVQASYNSLLSQYPNNALVFSVTQQKLQNPDVQCVCYGLKSIEHTPGLDRFKVAMGFTYEPVGLEVVLNWPFTMLSTAVGHRLLRCVSSYLPSIDVLRKASALMDGMDYTKGQPRGPGASA